MNQNLSGATTILLSLTVGCVVASAQRSNDGNKKPSAPQVVLSEVCYWPKEGESEWVELTNVSAEAVDLKGWQIVDGQALDFVITDKPFVLPPNGYLVVRLDGTGQPISMVKPNSWIAHSPTAVVGNLLGDKGGQVALYSPEVDVFNPSEIRSYVAWGRSPGRVVADAVKSERWLSTETGTVDSVIGTGPELMTFPVKTMRQGGSIGLVTPIRSLRYSSEDWGIFAPSEVNPGDIQLTRQVEISPLNSRTTDENGFAYISVVWMEKGTKYQFQLCSDANCENVLSDVSKDHANYRTEKPVPLGETYYWRVRLTFPDTSQSAWSEIRSIKNEG